MRIYTAQDKVGIVSIRDGNRYRSQQTTSCTLKKVVIPRYRSQRTTSCTLKEERILSMRGLTQQSQNCGIAKSLLRDRKPRTAACLACDLGDGSKLIEKCTARKKIFVLGRLEQPRQDKNLLCRQEESNEPTKKGVKEPLLFKL
jgi:hypothetical protein